MSDELKPCPFCGANDAVETDMEGMRRTVYFVSCNKCGAAGPSRVYPDHSQPLTEADLWNRRAVPEPEQSDWERADEFIQSRSSTAIAELNKDDLADLAREFAAVRAEADRWVPVAERLPEETGPHLVWFNYGSNTMSLVTTWFVHGKWALPSYDHRTVTHWKPIKGPEEGK